MPRTTVDPATLLPRPPRLVPLAVLAAAFAPGCTAVLGTASLQDMIGTGDQHAAEDVAEIADGDPQPNPDESTEEQATDEARRAAAIDEAVSRLARLGHLDEAARATLLATLERTEQEDWPAVVEAFAESLPAADPAPSDPEPEQTVADEAADTEVPPAAPPVHVVAKADLDAPAEAAEPLPESLANEPPRPATATTPPAPSPGVDDAAMAEPAAAPEPAASPEPRAGPDATGPLATGLAVTNAAFASRVQAWGVLDRFAADRFQPGQDVIVYFELDGLSAGESAAGHTTCIDAVLRLVGDDGSLVHQWSFEPIAETCRARRRDYFARYVVTIPATADAGPHRVELVVTDTLSGEIARGELPLEILPAAD